MIKSYSKTDKGILRKMNQDCCYESSSSVGKLPNLFIVADGMGGHRAGDYASKYTVEKIREHVIAHESGNIEEIVNAAIEDANDYLRYKQEEDENLYGMGTTVVVAVVDNGTLKAANVGDSRLYIVSKNEIRQVTVDHSLVEEMIQKGGLSRISAKNHPDKNIITRAVGAMDTVEADFFTEKLTKGDIVLMCSDGLTNMVDDDDIQKIVQGNGTLEEKCTKLIDEANRNGGKDNITALLADPFANEEDCA